ncbi:MAG: nucleotidyltransferase [Thermoplasmata archaeon]|nr:nucleotidyltransferase [Thermoplasmata archaeon]MBR4243780.1 nucleotidyltransferase domain-containing protein [Candidatus Methanomethylophilaceae archaeon]
MPKTESKNISVEELIDIVRPIAEQNGVSRVRLFGSRARGDFNADSDFDFLIDVKPGFGLIDLGCFTEDLEEALGRPVSIVDEVSASPTFLKSINKDLREIYG